MSDEPKLVTHPLDGIGIAARNFKCFGPKGLRTDVLQPINILIGRNNSGKSSVVDVFSLCISKGKSFDPLVHGRNSQPFEITLEQQLTAADLGRVFQPNTSGGGIPGNHAAFGRKLVGQCISRSYGLNWGLISFTGPNLSDLQARDANTYAKQIAEKAHYPFDGVSLVVISAERDVVPEAHSSDTEIQSNGTGVTNLIRAFITNAGLPREEVQVELLRELNDVYAGDANFTDIVCQEDENTGKWEIFLSETHKGDIRLSQSGSSLKSVFLILAAIRLAGRLQKRDWKKSIFCLEEPENNLHPALLRRLLDFVATKRSELGFSLILTTHSPVAIDWSTRRSDSQVIHIRHNGKESSAKVAVRYEDSCNVLDDLDIRASDILQANGVVWVEGPTDRLYLRSWIEAHTNGQLREGTHFTVMYYGGKLLSHLSLAPPDEVDELISILSINRNSAVLIDSDRHPGSDFRKPRMRLNPTKNRIKSEVESIGGVVWITEGREIENYIPQRIVDELAGQPVPNLEIYQPIIDLPELAHLKGDKIELAIQAAPLFTPNDISSTLDLSERLDELSSAIQHWNHL